MRSTRLFLSFCLSFAVAVLLSAGIPVEKTRLYVSNYENVLGTSLELKVEATSGEVADRAEQAALVEIDRLNSVLSGYQATSEFSKWMLTRNRAIKVSEDLYQVLSLFSDWRSKTGGALDPAAEVISKVWKNAAVRQELPSQEALAAAVKKVKQEHYILDAEAKTATHLDDVPLILNSFAKSYIISKAADASARVAGVNSVVVNIGGDLVVKGVNAETVRISDPKANAENDAPMGMIRVRDRAVATSGNYRRGVAIGSNWYSHIVDPRTGSPVDEIISSTVIAENATDAGALATAFNVLSPGESKKLAASVGGVEYLLVTRDGKQYESEGWKKLETKLPSTTAIAPVVRERDKDKLWDTKYELVVNLELATFQEARVRRPFVAVWITAADGKAVRNLNVWYNKPRWLRDLTTWYKAYGKDITPESNPYESSTGATRSPGKYSLKWDGKDDAGNLVKAGEYTVNIEAAREHGTYQLITKSVKFTGKVTQVSLPGNVEIASASLDYRKKQGN